MYLLRLKFVRALQWNHLTGRLFHLQAYQENAQHRRLAQGDLRGTGPRKCQCLAVRKSVKTGQMNENSHKDTCCS